MAINRRSFLGILGASGAAAAVPAALKGGTLSSSLQADAAPSHPGWDPWLEINTANLVWNLQQVQGHVGGKTVMAVVKANAYGHGLLGVGRALQSAGVKHFLVGKLGEAQRLREGGVDGLILNYGPFGDASAEDIVRLGISQNIYTQQVEVLEKAAHRLQRSAHVHIKVDTGLGRLGVLHQRALEFIEQVASLPGTTIDGVFTTFTEDRDFDAVQLSRLQQICEKCAEAGISIGLRHAASSDAILDFPAAYEQLDMVRPGCTLYGLFPSPRAEWERKLDLKPVLGLKTRVAYVKTLSPGESVSYHRLYTALQSERIATLPAGYSDGFPKATERKGAVLLAGRRCPIVAITSNAIMVRLGDTPAVPGDEAVLIGTQGLEEISVRQVAQQANKSVYGVVMEMSGLLPRVYV